MSLNSELDATVTLLNTALAPRTAYTYNSVPSPRPEADHVVVSLERRPGGTVRLLPRRGRQGRRLIVEAFSRSLRNAQQMHENAQVALEGRRLPVPGRPSPIAFDADDGVEPNQGWFEGSVDFIYTIQEATS